jgi:predicted PurR-regulated permease PerM
LKPITFWRAVFALLALAFALVFVIHVWAIIVPFVLGLTGAYLIHPLVDRFVSMGLRRDRTVLVLYMLILFTVVTLGIVFVPKLISEANASLESLPVYAERFNGLNDGLSDAINKWLGRFQGPSAKTVTLPFRADALVDRFVTSIPENISSLAHFGMWILIVPFVCYFSLANGKDWLKNIFDWTPSIYVENLLGLMAEVNATLGGYIRGQLLDGLCVGTLTMAGLWMLGFDQSILIGILVGFLNPVPFLAPLVGGSITLLMGYFQGMGPTALFGIFCLFVLVRLCDDFIFTPFIVGQSVQLHPVAMLFAILAGVEVGGFLGLVFAVPAAAILKVVFSVVINGRRDNVLLGSTHIV